MSILFHQATIIGVGLIGGSLAKVAKEKGFIAKIVGIGRSKENLEKAKKLGVIDEFTTDLAKGVKEAQLVVVATPVGVIVKLIQEITPYLKPETIITDVGSVKEKIVRKVDEFLPPQLYFVGGHPIAGTENSGVEAAFSSLFKGKRCILTPTPKTNSSALTKIKRLWKEAGCTITLMDGNKHDKIFAAVSHLPHLVAYALINYLTETKEGQKKVLTYSAGGLKDFTRIAASHPLMWKDIVLMNKENLLSMIKSYQDYLEGLSQMIARENSEKLILEFQKARKVRRLMG